MNYSGYVTALSTLMVVPPSNTEFLTILPSIIDYAEQRIYRDLQLLSTVVRDTSAALTQNRRTFTLPQAQGRFVVVYGINIITPVGATTITGSRNELVSASRLMIDHLYPTEQAPTTPSVPQLYAMITDQIVIVGPAPDAAYNVEVVGTIRPAALSASNTTTFLTSYLPDLFLAGSMVFATGYQRDFGAQSDDPRMAVSWEAEYGKLLASANAEEIMKKYNNIVNGIPPAQPAAA